MARLEFGALDGRRLFLFGVLAALLAAAVYAGVSRVEEQPVVLEAKTAEETAAPAESLTVYVTGAVRRPGVYSLPQGARVYDAVEAAGKDGPYADLDSVNLSGRLTDGERIHIPVSSRPAAVSAGGPLVNLNRADAAELDRLPGVGEATAQKILDYRAEHGAFRSKEEIKDVPSIGEGKYKKLEDRITL